MSTFTRCDQYKTVVGIISVLLLSWLDADKRCEQRHDSPLYVLVAILAVSLIMFFAGGPIEGFTGSRQLLDGLDDKE